MSALTGRRRFAEQLAGLCVEWGDYEQANELRSIAGLPPLRPNGQLPKPLLKLVNGGDDRENRSTDVVGVVGVGVTGREDLLEVPDEHCADRSALADPFSDEIADVSKWHGFSLLAAARAATRYAAGALLLALWQLQRKAWARRAAATRPSGATQGGAA